VLERRRRCKTRTVLAEWVQSLEHSVSDLRTVSLNREIGEPFEDSNLNYVVLGIGDLNPLLGHIAHPVCGCGHLEVTPLSNRSGVG
jgi:hypothetical protein